MDDVIIATHRKLFRWHREEVTVVTDAGVLAVVQLGSEVQCWIGATTLKGRSKKLATPKDFKGQTGIVVVVHLEADDGADPADEPRLVELGVQLPGCIAWFSPAQITTVPDHQEFSHAV